VFNIIALPVGVIGLCRADFMPAFARDDQPEGADENWLFVFIRHGNPQKVERQLMHVNIFSTPHQQVIPGLDSSHGAASIFKGDGYHVFRIRSSPGGGIVHVKQRAIPDRMSL